MHENDKLYINGFLYSFLILSYLLPLCLPGWTLCKIMNFIKLAVIFILFFSMYINATIMFSSARLNLQQIIQKIQQKYPKTIQIQQNSNTVTEFDMTATNHLFFLFWKWECNGGFFPSCSSSNATIIYSMVAPEVYPAYRTRKLKSAPFYVHLYLYVNLCYLNWVSWSHGI